MYEKLETYVPVVLVAFDVDVPSVMLNSSLRAKMVSKSLGSFTKLTR